MWIEETPNYIPLVRKVFIIKWKIEILKTQQDLARHKEELGSLQVHEELRKKFEALTITKDETFTNFKDKQKKVEKSQAKVQKAKEKIETIFSLYSEALSCRAPATNYALFLLERYLLLKLKAIKAGKLVEFKTTPDFVKCF